MEQCEYIRRSVLGFNIVQIVLAVMILVVLSFTKKRARWCPNTWNGVPGLAMSVNLLRMTPHRVISAVAFASMSSNILVNFVHSPSLGSIANPYGQVFIEWLTTWLFVLLQALLYFPLFGCLYASIGWLGNMMGAVYSAAMLVKYVIQFVEVKQSCLSSTTVLQVWFTFGINLPVFICLFIILAYYVFGFGKEVRKAIQAMTQPSDDATDYYKEWVKDLFKYKRSETNTLLSNKYQPKVVKFSPKFISASSIMLVLIYQLTLLSIFGLLSLLNVTTYLLTNANLNLSLSADILQKIENGLTAAAVIGPCITSIIVLCILIHMIKCIRLDQMCIIRGDLSSFHIPNSSYGDSSFNVPIPTSEEVLSSSLDYMSYQIAYLIVSWILFLFALYGICVAVAILVLLFIFARTFILPKVISFIMFAILGWIMTLIQKYMCKHVFKDSTCDQRYIVRRKQEAKGTSIAHVQLYHWWAYVFFIFNTFGGLFSSLKRCFLSAFFVLFFMIRMDRNLYIRGRENLDGGYSTYIAVLYLEFAQNNPIANCFVQIMLDVRPATNASGMPVREMNGCLSDTQRYKGRYRVSRKARNRWYVAYTLLRNPGIQHGRMDEPLNVTTASLSKTLSVNVDIN